ncbi:MAG: acyl carrier protein [Pseudomonadota bacterium]
MSTTNKLAIIAESMDIELNTNQLHQPLDTFDEWDSISILGLMAKADEELGIGLSPDDLESAQTIRDLINLLDKNDD